MNTPLHPIAPEELMAYLDGELSAERAALVASHLEQCGECRVGVAESRALSQRLIEWQVAPAPPSLSEPVTAGIATNGLKPPVADTELTWRAPFPGLAVPRWAWAAAGGICLLLIVAAVTMPNLLRTREPARLQTYLATAPTPRSRAAAQDEVREARGYKGWLASTPAPAPSAPGTPPQAGGGGGGGAAPALSIPMIARTASLTLLAKDFEKTRAALVEVVRRHRGYSGELAVGSESGSARRLTATFKVPADQFDATIAEIKQLAPVVRESQSGEEVTGQVVDLTARLSNSRRTEQTLLDILDKRTGKLSDVLEVEQELARVREEIERMQAELKNLQNRVSFSTLQVELREEYKAELEISPSLGRRMSNALVEGFRTTADSVVGVVLFLLNVGPFLLLWGLILFWPARYLWRRVRSRLS